MLHREYTNSQNRKVDIWDSILLHLISVDHPSDWYDIDIISQKEAFIANVCSLHEARELYSTINTNTYNSPSVLAKYQCIIAILSNSGHFFGRERQ